METVSTIQELNEYAHLLRQNGFTIITPEKQSTYFFFAISDQIGYVQTDRFLCTTFSTVHKPCKECGTGFRYSEEYAELNLANAAGCAVCIAPGWAKRSDVFAVRKYKNVADFTSGWMHKDSIILTPLVS